MKRQIQSPVLGYFISPNNVFSPKKAAQERLKNRRWCKPDITYANKLLQQDVLIGCLIIKPARVIGNASRAYVYGVPNRRLGGFDAFIVFENLTNRFFVLSDLFTAAEVANDLKVALGN